MAALETQACSGDTREVATADGAQGREPRWLPVVVLATLLYGGLHLVWYWQTPLGQVPVLDERENIDLALQIAGGTLPGEPFYRAVGYPLVLALLARCGIGAQALPLAATALGLLTHVLNTVLAAAWARRLCPHRHAPLLSGLLYGLNPVLIHYATQVLDGTLANGLFLAGGLALASAPRSAGHGAAAGLAWSLATLVRPQFLFLWPAFPLIWWLAAGRPRLAMVSVLKPAAAGVLAGAVPLVALGLWQSQVSGSFRVLPTQGAYNAWAANRPGAHGRYFVQTVHLGLADVHRNPTRVESEVLFTKETGQPASDIDEVNGYWTARLRDAALQDPAGFLGRIARKCYFLINNAEQYNNKTYSVHKARSPWLRWNPIGWGAVLLLGLAGVIAGWRGAHARFGTVAVVGLVAAAPVVATLVSGRFRLPLVALGCVAAGSAALVPAWWQRAGRRARVSGGVALGVVAAIVFSRFGGVSDRATAVQDHILMADAAVQVGRDREAWLEAGEALHLGPEHPDALAWRITSYFNQLVLASAPLSDERAWGEAASRALTAAPGQIAPAVVSLAAVARWRAGETEAAAALWRRQLQDDALNLDAAGALFLAGVATPAEAASLREIPPSAGALARLAGAVIAADESPRGRFLRAAAQRVFARPQQAPPAGG